MRVSLEFKLEDLWMGVYWRRRSYWQTHDENAENTWRYSATSWDIWVCLIPCLPIHIEI